MKYSVKTEAICKLLGQHPIELILQPRWNLSVVHITTKQNLNGAKKLALLTGFISMPSPLSPVIAGLSIPSLLDLRQAVPPVCPSVEAAPTETSIWSTQVVFSSVLAGSFIEDSLFLELCSPLPGTASIPLFVSEVAGFFSLPDVPAAKLTLPLLLNILCSPDEKMLIFLLSSSCPSSPSSMISSIYIVNVMW